MYVLRGQVCYSDTILALVSRLTANCFLLIVNTARLTMLRMRNDAELTQRLQLEDLQSWACVGMADLTLKRTFKDSILYPRP